MILYMQSVGTYVADVTLKGSQLDIGTRLLHAAVLSAVGQAAH